MKYKILLISFFLANSGINAKLSNEDKDYIEIDIQDLMQNNNAQDSKVVIVTEQNYEVEVNQSQQPVVILVGTSWCPPCQIFKSIYAKVAEEFSDKFKFVRIDFDSYKSFFVKHQIRAVPVILFSVNGKIVEKRPGFLSKDNFKTMLCSTYEKLKSV